MVPQYSCEGKIDLIVFSKQLWPILTLCIIKVDIFSHQRREKLFLFLRKAITEVNFL